MMEGSVANAIVCIQDVRNVRRAVFFLCIQKNSLIVKQETPFIYHVIGVEVLDI